MFHTTEKLHRKYSEIQVHIPRKDPKHNHVQFIQNKAEDLQLLLTTQKITCGPVNQSLLVETCSLGE